MSRAVKWLMVAGGLVAPGCGAGDGTAGMSGRQVVRGHDVADVFFADSASVGFTRQASDPASSEPQDLWILGLADDAPQIALAGIDWSPPVRWASLHIGPTLETGPTGRLFYDFPSRRAADVASFGLIPLDAGTLTDGGVITGMGVPYPFGTALRRDGGAVALTGGAHTNLVGIGPPTDLVTFNLDGAIGAMDFLGSDLALLYAPESGRDPAAGVEPPLGVYRLSSSTGEPSLLVPATPAAEWVGTTMSCDTFGPSPCGLFKVVGCLATDPACAETGAPPCAVVYVKADPDNPGHTAAYAYDVNAGAGFKLPGRTPTHLYVAPDQHLVLWDDDQIVSKRYWNLCTGKKDFCPELAGNSVLWRSDSQGFVALDGAQNLAVANFTNNLCAGVPAASSVYGVAYSPAGDHLSWLTYSDSEQALWLAAPDGSAPIQIASGSIAGARFSPDGQRILLARSNAAATSSVSLGWLDLTASPPVEKLLAANYGGFSRGGDRRILLVDHWNTQDTSGELALIDVANGTRLVLGRAVTEFAVSGDVDAAGTNLAYAVRSRIAADRDGLWLAALPP